MRQLRERILRAVLGDTTAQGVQEQHAALRLLEETARTASTIEADIGLFELVRVGLASVTKLLLSTVSKSLQARSLALVAPPARRLPLSVRIWSCRVVYGASCQCPRVWTRSHAFLWHASTS